MTDTAPSTSAAPPPAPRRRMRWLLWVAAVPVVLLLLVSSIAWWASSDGSLPRALQLAQRFLPEGQMLQFSDAQGSVTGGGRIGQLHWSMPGTAVSIDGLHLDWSLRELLGRALHVRALEASQVHVQLSPVADDSPSTPFTMPEDLSLPLELTLPLRVGLLQVEMLDEEGGVTALDFEELDLLYGYDGTHHALRLDHLRHEQSAVQADLQLHAREMTLAAQVGASLRDLAPDTPLAMLVWLQADGTLAGGDAAAIDLRLDAAEQLPAAPSPDARRLLTELQSRYSAADQPDAVALAGMQVHGRATVHPWREQPAEQLDLRLGQFNAHAFHEAAPVTDISGEASVQPVGGLAAQQWDVAADFVNGAPGAWDRERVPLRTLQIAARLSTTLLDITAAEAQLGGTAPAGALLVTGQVPLQQPLGSALRLEMQQLDLRPLLGSLPVTTLNGELVIEPLPQDTLRVRADVRNTRAGPWDRERLPAELLQAALRIAPDTWQAESLRVRAGPGYLQAQGSFQPEAQRLDLRAELRRLPLAQIHGKLASEIASELSGNLVVAGGLQQSLAFEADISSNATAGDDAAPRGEWEIRAIETRGRWSPTRLQVERVHMDAFQATVDGSDIDVVLPGLDSIRARVSAQAPGITLETDAAMQLRAGEGKLAVQLESAERLVEWLRGLPLLGEQMPDVQARGAASLQADWQGGWRQWVDGIGNPAAYPDLRMDVSLDSEALQVDWPAGIPDEPPTQIRMQQLHVDLQGNLAAAALVVDGDMRINDAEALLDVRMQMTQAAADNGVPSWNFLVEQFDVAATLPDESDPWRVQLAQGLEVSVQTGDEMELRASAGTLALIAPPAVAGAGPPLELAWEPAMWRRAADGGTTMQSVGAISGIQPAWVDALMAPDGPLAGAGMSTDLLLSGEWDIQMTDQLDVRAHLKRDSGDVWRTPAALGPDTAPVRADIAAGFRTFDLLVQSDDEDVSLALDWDTERAGVITARLRTQMDRRNGGWSLEGAPLAGTLQARLQDLGAWGFLAPPGWRVQGELEADITVAGTVQEPELQGGIEGRRLNIRSVLDGVDLNDGVLRATLAGQQLQLEELTLQGGTGSRAYVRGISGNRTQPPSARGRMTASGSIDWSGVADAEAGQSGIEMDVRAELERMQVLVRNDRQMSLSGQLSAGLQQGALTVRGDLRVDRASIVLPEAGAPTLGDDVAVVRYDELQEVVALADREVRTELQTATPMDLEIKVNLGRDLALEGQGITTRLEGELTVRSNPGGSDPFTVVGEVRTDEGRYRAWGQALNVETGVVRFNGPYTNPSLELLAIRPEIEVRAGVRVTGTLAAPRVQLFSEPDLPEAEKLSWVVLGRATAVGGAEGTSMQRAALGLLAGQLSGGLASGLGLDELGLGDSSVSIGKRISDELYVTYEAGLSGAASTLYIFYDITRRLTVRGETGDASAVDLIYTIDYD